MRLSFSVFLFDRHVYMNGLCCNLHLYLKHSEIFPEGLDAAEVSFLSSLIQYFYIKAKPPLPSLPTPLTHVAGGISVIL